MDTVSRYFKDIRKSKPLTREEEIELATRVQAGDETALNKLITSNLKFVVTIARQYMGRGLELEDLISEGNIGLIEAAKRFDPNEGYRLISYSVFWIRQAIMSAINNNRLIRLPMNRVCTHIQINKITAKYLDTEGRKPTESELSKEIGVSVADIRTLLRASRYAVSIDEKIGDDDEDGTTLEEIIADPAGRDTDAEAVRTGLVEDIEIILKISLTEREAMVIKKSFGINCDPEDDDTIGKNMGITGERCRQIRLYALSKLRKTVGVKEILRDYLG